MEYISGQAGGFDPPVGARRMIVIGSNRWQSANTFDKLRIPKNDRSILLSFHFYEPFFLTHYQASWTNLRTLRGCELSWQIVLNSTLRSINGYTIAIHFLRWCKNHCIWQIALNCLCIAGNLGSSTRRPANPNWHGTGLVSIFEEKGIAYATGIIKPALLVLWMSSWSRTAMVKILTHGK